MKKKLTVLFAFVFAIAFLASYLGRTANAAAPTTCYYKCICSVPHKCCKTNGVETCKPVPDAPISCTQNYPC